MDEAEGSHAPGYIMSVLAAYHEHNKSTDQGAPLEAAGVEGDLRTVDPLWTWHAVRAVAGVAHAPRLPCHRTHHHQDIPGTGRQAGRILPWRDPRDGAAGDHAPGVERRGARTDDSLARIRAEILELCATIPAGDQSRTNCEAFLASIDSDAGL